MQESTEQQTTERQAPAVEKKTGFMGRLIKKLDKSFKEKADQQSQRSGSCCDGGDKGGKCC